MNKIGKDGKSLLMTAAKRTSSDLIKILMKRGAKVDYQSENGNTALHELVFLQNENSESEIIKCLEFLVEGSKKLIKIKNKEGKYAFDMILKWFDIIEKTKKPVK